MVCGSWPCLNSWSQCPSRFSASATGSSSRAMAPWEECCRGYPRHAAYNVATRSHIHLTYRWKIHSIQSKPRRYSSFDAFVASRPCKVAPLMLPAAAAHVRMLHRHVEGSSDYVHPGLHGVTDPEVH